MLEIPEDSLRLSLCYRSSDKSSDHLKQRPASAMADLPRRPKGRGAREFSLDDIQDLFTRPWTFSYHNPSKTHLDHNKKTEKKAKAL